MGRGQLDIHGHVSTQHLFVASVEHLSQGFELGDLLPEPRERFHRAGVGARGVRLSAARRDLRRHPHLEFVLGFRKLSFADF